MRGYLSVQETAWQILGDSGGCREADKTEVRSQAPENVKQEPLGGFLFCPQVSIF